MISSLRLLLLRLLAKVMGMAAEEEPIAGQSRAHGVPHEPAPSPGAPLGEHDRLEARVGRGRRAAAAASCSGSHEHRPRVVVASSPHPVHEARAPGEAAAVVVMMQLGMLQHYQGVLLLLLLLTASDSRGHKGRRG